MKRGMGFIRKTGFTLIEILVTVVIIGVLAAVVIPAVTAQVTAGDSSRVLSDLNNVRTGIENFDIAVRQYPGDVDDLVNTIGTSVSSTGADVDADVTGALYLATAPALWAGPYMETSLPLAATSSTLPNASVAAFNTGYAATINNAFARCKITDLTSACLSTGADYVTVQVNSLTAGQAASLDNLIDGSGAVSTTGKFRYITSNGSSTGYYYAAPYK